jgi:hypothetical protein
MKLCDALLQRIQRLRGTQRTVGHLNALAAGASSGPIPTTFTLPTNLNGTYYMITCANYNNAVVETNSSDNCTASAPCNYLENGKFAPVFGRRTKWNLPKNRAPSGGDPHNLWIWSLGVRARL